MKPSDEGHETERTCYAAKTKEEGIAPNEGQDLDDGFITANLGSQAKNHDKKADLRNHAKGVTDRTCHAARKPQNNSQSQGNINSSMLGLFSLRRIISEWF